jgi:ABC-2 type transport system permease protein
MAERGAVRKVVSVAVREFRATVLTKGFVLGVVLAPVIGGAAMLIAGWAAMQGMAPVSGTLAILDPTGSVPPLAADELSAERQRRESRRALEEGAEMLPAGAREQARAAAASATPNVDIRVEAVADPAREGELRAQVADGSLLGLAIVGEGALAPRVAGADAAADAAGFTLIVPPTSAPRVTGLLERSVAQAIVRARVARAGADWASLDALMAAPDASVRRLAEDGTEASESVAARLLMPLGFMMLVWIATFSSGQYLLTATIEEKSNKVMEVILSAVSPMQLLTGKILGYAMVSALIVGVYGSVGIAGLAAAAMADLVSPWSLALLAVYFVMAYGFVATMMAGAGSAVSDLQEAQGLLTPIMLVLTLPLLLFMPVTEHPNGWIATTMSFVPPAIPFIMALRLAASGDPVPAWQVAATLVWGFAWVGVFLWAGAKVFRVGILMQGKPPTPRELWRWIRMA